MEQKKVACVLARDDDPILLQILADSGWEIERLDVARPAKRTARTYGCAIGVVALTVPAPWLARLESAVAQLGSMTWVAVVDRARLSDQRVREFIAVHCVDYQTLPLERDRLRFALGHAAGMAELAGRSQREAGEAAAASIIFGGSSAMNELRSDLSKIAASDAPVLITGEIGTGKELVARTIHAHSCRREQDFVAINCVSLPPSVGLAELFGCDRRVPKSAGRRGPARCEAAQRGTVFLDEVAELHPELQALVLRFLEDQVVQRSGGGQLLRVDMRVVATTRVDLESAVARGTFREDLYYRLNVLRVRMPPLRERGDDIVELAEMLLARFGGKKRAQRGFSTSALGAMRAYGWPGNVRELLNRLRRAIVMCEGHQITPRDLNLPTDGSGAPVDLNLETARAQAERSTILAALECSEWNAAKCAPLVGVSRATFYRLLEKHGFVGERAVPLDQSRPLLPGHSEASLRLTSRTSRN